MIIIKFVLVMDYINREMNKMLIYALQKELGISQSSATGTWGPTTTSLCKQKAFTLGESNSIVRLVRYATVCNGFSVSTSSSTYDSSLDSIIKDFCESLMITKPSNKINYSVIKSLLSSNGDIDRSALGCDTATRLDQKKITTLKNNGYKIVGRYLTNVVGGTLDKKMTEEEIKLILDNGLSIFSIFQEYGGENSAFSKIKGEQHARVAYQAAVSFGIPFGTTIFFAVDYDPQTAEIEEFIVNYFQGVYDAMQNISKRQTYKIGVYGTRNVCSILKNKTSLVIRDLFISDASYGFSGNLGFTMPNSWSFDQFSTDITIGTGDAKISIDKVAVSGRCQGFNYVKKDVTTIEKVYETIEQLYNVAMACTNNNRLKSNLFVAQYIRNKEKVYQTSLWDLTGGEIDESFESKANFVEQTHNFSFKDPLTNGDYDLAHMMATLSSVLYVSKIPGFDLNWEVFDPLVDVFAGWGGDLTTFSKDIENAVKKGQVSGDYQVYANNLICKGKNSSSFPLEDYNADIDAVVFGYLINSTDIASVFYDYFIANDGEISKNRTRMFIRNAYGDIDRFSTAVNAFSDGMFPDSPFADPMDYLKKKLLGGEPVPSLEFRRISANAFLNFVKKEF